MRDAIARALIDADPSISGYHQSHIDVMQPRVDAVMAVVGPEIQRRRAEVALEAQAEIDRLRQELDGVLKMIGEA